MFLAITSVGWGLNWPIMKYLLTEWPPLSSRGLTGIVGAARWRLIALARRQSLRRAAADVAAARAGVGAAQSCTLWMALMGLALLWLPASEAAVIGLHHAGLDRAAGLADARRAAVADARLALTMAFAGIAVLMGGNGIDASLDKLPGIMLALAGAVGFALGTVLPKHFPTRDAAAAPRRRGRSALAACRSRSSAWPSSIRSLRRCHRSAGPPWSI